MQVERERSEDTVREGPRLNVVWEPERVVSIARVVRCEFGEMGGNRDQERFAIVEARFGDCVG